MRFRSTFRLALAGVACAALSFAVALALPVQLVRPQPHASHTLTIGDSVNRAGKEDQLRVIVRPPDTAPPDVKLPDEGYPQLPDGCESILGRMVHSSAAKLPRDCLT